MKQSRNRSGEAVGLKSFIKGALHAVGYQLRRIPTEHERIAESIEVLRKAGEGAVHAVGYQLRRIPTERERITESLILLHNAGVGSELSRRTLGCAIQYLSYAKSELFQDIFVLTVLREKRNGFFVEFGAGDGVRSSNTHMLEKEFGWTGILAEPNRTFSPNVATNRSCAVDSRCVWSATGETVSFTETTECGEFSTISEFAQCDFHDRSKKRPIEYQVKTVSLNDLLVQHRAPAEIDYLSIDTEGSELAILRALDFKRWRFNVITAEHNWVQSAREGIHALLTSHGYSRVMTEFSYVDDWYIRNELPTP